MNALRIAIACLVAVVWAVIYLASVFNPTITAPPEVSGVMLAVVTWLFGRALRDGLTKTIREKAKQIAELPDLREQEKPPDEPEA